MTSQLSATTSRGDVARYEIRLAGHLDDHWSAVLGDLTLARRGDATTTLTGPLADQAQLHGVLGRLRDLGVTLLTLRSLDGDEAPPTPGQTAPVAVPPALTHPLRTERLTLRPATTGDADATWTYRRLDSVALWLAEMPTDLDSHRVTFADPHRLATTVIIEQDGLVVGDLMLRGEDARAQSEVADQARATQAELGWVLDPAHTGHGYATEAVHGLVGYCLSNLGIRRVVATCFLADDASSRLMERLGMRREGHTVGGSLHRSGRWLDTVTYAALATEWPT